MFKPWKKRNILLIPSIPYKASEFKERGIDKLINILKKAKIKSTIIFRSKESYDYFKKLNLENARLINEILADKKLAEIMSSAGIIPLIYLKNAPDMPLSAVEGLASGCALICTENMGISDMVKTGKCGIIVKSDKDIINAIGKISKNSSKNARKMAEKYFDKEQNIRRYLELM